MPQSREARSEAQRRRRAKKRAEKLAADAPPVTPPDGTPTGPPPVEALPLASAADALAVLREQVNAVRAGGNQSICRTLAYAIAVSLKAIEITDIAARLAVLEAEAAARKKK